MKFRKKPVVIDAIKWEENTSEVIDFLGYDDQYTSYHDVLKLCAGTDESLIIHTLEGDMNACKGDYIIKGVKGEFYPCKPDIFEETYEPVDEKVKNPLTPEEIKKEAIKKLMELHGIEINQTFFIDGWALNKTTYGHFMFDENLELKTEDDVNTTQMVVLMIVCPEAIHTHLTPEMVENDIFFLLNPRPIARDE